MHSWGIRVHFLALEEIGHFYIVSGLGVAPTVSYPLGLEGFLFKGGELRQDVKLSTYLYLLMRFRIYGAMPPFSYIVMVWYSIKHSKHAAFTFVGHFETYVLLFL